ncbi:MAG: hypoxanthine phosphoribosyltransferase [Clostridiales bacterium]|jgi:hypoxanthine phosphoribosyltransferase|nr:hypoxanthine phosphoribosyltransferase [Clostridiales bacterium]
MPKITKVLIESDKIAHRIKELGAQITQDYAGKTVLMIAILRGSVIFFSDLIREIDSDKVDVVIDFISVSSYGSSHKTTGEVRMLKDADEAIDGKDVIIVEDIVDTGLTLQYLKKVLSSRNPASLKVCCLLDKPERRKVEISADYLGFTIPNEFVVGYGFDYAQKYRNLKDICVLDPKAK